MIASEGCALQNKHVPHSARFVTGRGYRWFRGLAGGRSKLMLTGKWRLDDVDLVCLSVNLKPLIFTTTTHSSTRFHVKAEHFPAKSMLNLHHKCQGSVLFVLYLRHCPCRHCRLSPLKCRSLLPASPADKRSTSHYYPACICRCHCTDRDSLLCTQKQSTHIREGTFQ